MNSFLASLFFAVFLLVSSHAFMAIRHPHHHFGTQGSTIEEVSSSSALATVPKLNDVDLMAIENVAELCLHTEKVLSEECDLDQHEALVQRLQAQRSMILDQVTYIDDLLNRLQGNSADMKDE